jgi:hypothetical protein
VTSSSDAAANTVLVWVMLVVGLRIAFRHLAAELPAGTRPWRVLRPVAVGLWLVVAVPSVLQGFFPSLLTALQRDPSLVRDGQVWRLVTSVVVQDGGVVGTVFNLVVLALVALAACRIWGGATSVCFFVIGAVVFNLLMVFAFPQHGAGNSAATFTLVCSIAGLVLVRREAHDQTITAGLVPLAGVALLAIRDAHGFAVLLGVALGAVMAWVRPPPSLAAIPSPTGALRRPGAQCDP